QLFLHQSQEPPSPRKVKPTVPMDLEAVCLKCLEKDTARRYPDCQALADDLRRWLEGEPVRARQAGVVERLRKWVRRRPAQAALVGVSILALLVVGLGLVGHLVSLRAEQARTAAQRDVAVRRLAFSLEAVDRMLKRNAEVELLSIPLMEEARRHML